VSATKPIVSVTTPNGPIVDIKTGSAVFSFLKWMQQVGQLLNQVFDNQGALSPDSIPFPTSTSLGGVTSAGPVTHQWINSIDSTGTPLLSQPAFTDLSGTAAANQIPPLSALSGSVTAGQVPALSALNGSVTPAQVPPLSSLNGSVTAGQVPNLSALNGQITEAQLPASGQNVTIITAKLTTGGANGSMTFTNGILTAQVQAT
jgi:hypothetical protein